MAFLKDFIASGVSNVIRAVTTGTFTEAGDVIEIHILSEYVLSHQYRLVKRDQCFYLYSDRSGKRHDFVVYNMNNLTTSACEAFSLRRYETLPAATTHAELVQRLLWPLAQTCPNLFRKEKLQCFIDVLDDNPCFTSAHMACALGLTDGLEHVEVRSLLLEPVGDDKEYPVHTSIRFAQFDCLASLLRQGLPLDGQRDAQGNSILHYISVCDGMKRSSDTKLVVDVCRMYPNMMNVKNNAGETSVAYTCHRGRQVALVALIGCEANLDVPTDAGLYPIHLAVRAGAMDCVSTLCTVSDEQVKKMDRGNGYTPLHYVTSSDMAWMLIDEPYKANVDARGEDGKTPLCAKVEECNIECVMALLSHLADPNLPDNSGNTPLHAAARIEDTFFVKALIVFGSNLDHLNNSGHSPLHLASVGSHEKAVRVLVEAGASKCAPDVGGCNEGCHAADQIVKCQPTPTDSKFIPQCKPDVGSYYDEVVRHSAVSKVLSEKEQSETGRGVATKMAGTAAGRGVARPPCSLLSLDGGGIRGLILVQILLAIEKFLGDGVKIGDVIHWIAGTSTGGILALAIVSGYSLRECQALYFRLKEKVFCGVRPYPSEPLEHFLQKVFGTETKLTDLPRQPRVVVTGVLADRDPAILHLFRSYEYPAAPVTTSSTQHPHSPWFTPPNPPTNQVVWRAARATGAAPTYFNAWGRFVDGGLIANNPTLDLLTEVEEYNEVLSSVGYQHEVRPPGLVMSIGTGKLPVRCVSTVELVAPSNMWEAARSVFGAKELGSLIVEQATSSDGRVVDRARAWCSSLKVPYFRWNPQLQDEIRLDETDDRELVDMCYNTYLYMLGELDAIKHLVTLLRAYK